MLPDADIDDIAAANQRSRDEDRAVKDLILISESEPEILTDFQEICDFLNQFKISVGEGGNE